MLNDESAYEDVSVLLVEDDLYTRNILKGMLRQMGIRSVIQASNGHEGWSELLRTRPTLVLCDIHMTPVDGREFLKRVRGMKQDWLKNMPVIFLTADAQPQTVRFAKALQVNGYLVKPVSLNELKTRIDGVLKALGPRPKTGSP